MDSGDTTKAGRNDTIAPLNSDKAIKVVFKPSTMDPGFLRWHNSGIICFEDPLIDNTMASFVQMEDKFNLLNSDFVRYLQLLHFFCFTTAKILHHHRDRNN